jgi:hypothetical protein
MCAAVIWRKFRDALGEQVVIQKKQHWFHLGQLFA